MSRLIMKRKPQDEIYIDHPDGRITVKILDVSGTNVSIGINAPRSVNIERDNMRRPDICRCGAESFGDAGGLCWPCFKRDQED